MTGYQTLSDTKIREYVAKGFISGVESSNIQPASIDLTIGQEFFQVKGSFIPGSNSSVQDFLDEHGLICSSLRIGEGYILKRGFVYLFPLKEQVALPQGVCIFASPRSSVGRLDVFVRLVTDFSCFFDRTPESYKGPLYILVIPQSFSFLLYEGDSLNQIRICRVIRKKISNSAKVPLCINLSMGQKPVGFYARATNQVVSLRDEMNKDDFWEPLYGSRIFLRSGFFYIFCSEDLIIFDDRSLGNMIPFMPSLGDIRIHYAGFFDPGFGFSKTSLAVFEVRCFEPSFFVYHKQIIGYMIREEVYGRIEEHYGKDRLSYQGQKLSLFRLFK